MKYNILINQKSLLEEVPKITINEAVVFAYLFDICALENTKMSRIEKNAVFYTWINYSELIRQLPILKIKSIGTVSKIIKELKKYGLIDIIKDNSKGIRKTYISLTDKAKSVVIASFPQETDRVSYRKDACFLQETDNTNIDNTNNNNLTSSEPAAGHIEKEVNHYLAKFKEINPAFSRLYSNRTQRGAMARLIKGFKEKGQEEKLAQLISQVLPETNERKYFPVITTPLELESKLGKLLALLKQEAQKGKKIIFTYDQIG